jgi:tight adherence protein B
MPDFIIISVFGATLVVVLLVATATGAFSSEMQRRMQRRLKRVETATVPQPHATGDPAVDLRRNVRDSSIPGLDRLIKRFLPRPAALRQRLAQTGKRISPGEYLLASALLAIAVGVVMGKFLHASPALAGLAGIAAGFALPHALIGLLIERRLKAFTGQFPEAIDLIVRGLKSGLPVPASMHTVAEEMQEPVAGLFRLITDRLRFGQNLDEAMRDAADVMPTAEFRFFVISLAVQRETGGNLAETLENLTDILRKRRQMKLKIKAMSSEAKASALILGSLPFLLFLALWVINPGYVGALFTDPRGMMMLGAGLTSLGIGIAVMAKMVRFEI